MKPLLGTTKDAILDAFKALAQAKVGVCIVEAHIVGTGLHFRWQSDGKLGVAVGEIGIRPATAAEYDELEESIELGQVQVYQRPLWVSGARVTRDVVHQATGFPLDENSPAAIRQRNRWARAQRA